MVKIWATSVGTGRARGVELCDAGEGRRSGGGCGEGGVSGFPGVPGRTLTGSGGGIGAAGATGTGAGAAAGAGAGAEAEGTGKPAGAAPPNKAGAADIACIACIIAGFDMSAANAAGFAIVACMAAGANAAGFAMAAINACCCACCVCKAASATAGSIAGGANAGTAGTGAEGGAAGGFGAGSGWGVPAGGAPPPSPPSGPPPPVIAPQRFPDRWKSTTRGDEGGARGIGLIVRQRGVGPRPSRRIDVRSTVAEFARRFRARVRRRWSRVERSRAPISECAPHVPASFRAGFSAALVARFQSSGLFSHVSAVPVDFHRCECANSLELRTKSASGGHSGKSRNSAAR